MADTIHNEQEIEKSFDAHIMRRLFKFAKPQAFVLFISVVLMLFVTAMDLAIPYFTKIAIDDYISPSIQRVYVTTEGADDAPLVLPTLFNRYFGDAPGGTVTSTVLYKDDGLYVVKGLDVTDLSSALNTETEVLVYEGESYTVEKLTAAQVAQVDRKSVV